MRFSEAEWMAYQESGDDEIEAILDWDYLRDSEEE